MRRRARRVGTHLAVSWAGRPDQAASHDWLHRVEELGRFDWAEWTDELAPVFWSPGLFRVLDRDPAAGPVRLDEAFTAVIAEDQHALELLAQTVVNGLPSEGVELRLRSGSDVKTVAVVSAARRDGGAGERLVLTVVLDMSQLRRRDTELLRAAEQLATQRVQVASQRAQTEELRSALFPVPQQRRSFGPLSIVAHHAAPSSFHKFRGDFYDVFDVAGCLYLLVGDVFGSGVDAANAMVRLRHAARALALSGLGPAAVLDLLNRELCGDQEPPLASVVVALFDQDAGAMSWAQAGHYSPVLVRGDRGRSLRRPSGHALGLKTDTRYGQIRVPLCPGDLLVFFTDGVLARQNGAGHPIRRLTTGFLAAYRAGGAQSLIDRCLAPAQDEACLVVVEWPDADRNA